MKLIGSLIVMVSIVLGVVGAVTAYLPKLSLPDDRLVGLTLNAPAGKDSSDPTGTKPIAAAGAELTVPLLVQLRADGVTRVRVREFALGRWSEIWVFSLGVTGLLVGGMMLRMAAGRGRTGLGAVAGIEEARVALQAIAAAVDRLRSERPSLASDIARDAAVLEQIGHVQKVQVPIFLSSRPVLTAVGGIGGYARVMDRFAAAERQINRSWSAAADSATDESAACLEKAAELLAATRERLDTLLP